MARERTLCIIKPDATRRNLTGKILSRIEERGLKVTALRMKHLSQREAENFYAEHRGKPFYEPLVAFMISAPVVVGVLEGESAIKGWRELMGATDREKAAPGTIRREFALSVRENSSHGSDSPESAQREIAFFFPEVEISAAD
jgi:nucleoside-diphosphate kinase